MIKTICLFSFLLLVINTQAQVKTATITGTSDTILTMTLSVVKQNGLLYVSDTITTAAGKVFRQKIAIEKPTWAQLVMDKKSLEVYQFWLIPGATLRVQFKDGDATFSGVGSEFADYYKKGDFTTTSYRENYISRHPDFKNNANDYVIYLDSVTQHENQFLASYFATGKGANPKVQQFLKEERTSIMYKNLYYKLVFSGSDIERFKYAQFLFKSDKPAYPYSDQIEFKKLNLFSNRYYQAFAQQFVAGIALKKQKAGGKPFDIEPYLDIAMHTADELAQGDSTAIEIKVLVLNKIIEEISNERKYKWITKVQATLRGLLDVNENERLTLLQIKLDNIIADTRLKKGSPAPDFVLTDTAGKKYSLMNFKGKKILMDIGASWCKPCVEGIPSWNTLVRSYKGKDNVVFISLSLDDSRDNWQKWVKHHPEGLLLNADLKGFKSDFATAYLVKSLPKLILLDEEGKMDEYNAPAPNSKEILEKLTLQK